MKCLESRNEKLTLKLDKYKNEIQIQTKAKILFIFNLFRE